MASGPTLATPNVQLRAVTARGQPGPRRDTSQNGAQTAAETDLETGWSTLADRYGFALLLPEQQRSNNPNGCFNWFDTGDIGRPREKRCPSDRSLRKSLSIGVSTGGASSSLDCQREQR